MPSSAATMLTPQTRALCLSYAAVAYYGPSAVNALALNKLTPVGLTALDHLLSGLDPLHAQRPLHFQKIMLALSKSASPMLTFDVNASSFQLLAMLSRERSLASDLGLLNCSSSLGFYACAHSRLISDDALAILYARSPQLQKLCPPRLVKASLTPAAVKHALQVLCNGAPTLDESSSFYTQLPSTLPSLVKQELADYTSQFLRSRYPLTFALVDFLSSYAKAPLPDGIKTALLSTHQLDQLDQPAALFSSSLRSSSHRPLASLPYEYAPHASISSSFR